MAKLCTVCGESQKARGHSTRCTECLEATWSAPKREAAADERLAMIPERLRLARVPPAQWPAGRRWCSGCQSFVRLKDCQGAKCKTCAGRVAHASMVARTYVIHGRPFTEDDYQFLFKQQGGRCWVCERKSETKRLAVDHDHETGEVRGLLCPDIEWGCNRGIIAKIRSKRMARRVWEYMDDPPAQRLIKK